MRLDDDDDMDDGMGDEDEEVRRQSDDNFNIDEDFLDQNPSDYRIQNITRDLQEALHDQEDWKEFDCSDPENHVLPRYDDVDYEYDEFKGYEKRIEKYKESRKIFREVDEESFYYAILYGSYFKLKGDGVFTEETESLIEILGEEFLNSLTKKRLSPYLNLNLNTFERQCHEINDLLISKRLFLRVFEQRKKFCYLIKKSPNEVEREISSLWKNILTVSK